MDIRIITARHFRVPTSKCWIFSGFYLTRVSRCGMVIIILCQTVFNAFFKDELRTMGLNWKLCLFFLWMDSLCQILCLGCQGGIEVNVLLAKLVSDDGHVGLEESSDLSVLGDPVALDCGDLVDVVPLSLVKAGGGVSELVVVVLNPSPQLDDCHVVVQVWIFVERMFVDPLYFYCRL